MANLRRRRSDGQAASHEVEDAADMHRLLGIDLKASSDSPVAIGDLASLGS
jgi:hypothetical protein